MSKYNLPSCIPRPRPLKRHSVGHLGVGVAGDEDEDGAPGGRKKPTLVSIPNPLYSGSRAFSEPFGDAGQGLEPEGPEEPPKILDLDQ
ncbi:hypothetical protein EYF80_029094 [Liparis tanakae]|uniref:Uncharacterized protein n=1 Tax=Liparis tanakae TaxID=230148 RepID=A0A4Z2H5I2_9TELE|nr:hypothetical protein EYF80_029094 [Liparis tanakae]